MIKEGCVVCCSKEYSLEYIVSYGQIIKCSACELVYTSFNDPNIFYEENKSWETSDAIKAKLYNLSYERSKAYKRLKLLMKYCPSGSLIEFGSNTGEFLFVAAKNGFHITGVDHSPILLSLNKISNQEYIVTDVSNFSTEKKFNAVVAFHFFEHLEDPKLFLEKIKKILLQESILFLEVPNYDSHKRIKNGKNWNLFFKYHVSHFGIKSLSKLLKTSGFTILEYKTLQPMDSYITPYYLPVRHYVWSFLKQIFVRNNKPRLHEKEKQKLSITDEKEISNCLKAKLFRLETTLINLLSFPFFIHSYIVSKNGKGDILQIVAKKTNE